MNISQIFIFLRERFLALNVRLRSKILSHIFLIVSESPDIKSSLPQQSTDSDAVLLSTLQNEIARLVKEVVIYQQRSEVSRCSSV